MSAASSSRPGVLRFLTWWLGAWFLVAAFTGYEAGANLTLLKPEKLERSAEFFSDVPQKDRSAALRYAASELNRRLFRVSYSLQMALAAVALVALVASRRRGRLLWGFLIVTAALSIVLLFWITPEMTDLGRQLDDVPREPLTPDREHFQRLHKTAVWLDSAKVLLILCASVAIMWLPAGRTHD